MNCRNFHPTGQDPRCPYCIIKILIFALEKHDPFAAELTPAMMLMTKAQEQEQRDRRDARPR